MVAHRMTSPSAPPPVGGEAQEAATKEALELHLFDALVEVADRYGATVPSGHYLDAIWPLIEPLILELGSLRRDNEALTAKLALPCGSCHPCDNWADETWRREGKKPPAVITWQDTLELKRELIADLDLAQSRLTAALTENEALRAKVGSLADALIDAQIVHELNPGARCDVAQRIGVQLRALIEGSTE